MAARSAGVGGKRLLGPDVSCFVGSAPGAWHGGQAPEWVLSNGSGCSPLRRYVWVDPQRCTKKVVSTVPGGGTSNLASCVQHDAAQLWSELANTSVLMLGDSTAAQVLWHACDAFSAHPKSLVRINSSVPLKKYAHRLRSLDNHACRLAADITLGSFSHYGVAGPPYWVFAYPLPPWLADNTPAMVRENVPRFRSVTKSGGDPTVIIASSGFWDIAAWWAHEGNFTRRWSMLDHREGNHTERYVHGVHRMVREVRRTFPQSVVVWRLMHPGMKHSITPPIVRELNDAVRSAAQSWKLPLLDVEAMVSSLRPVAQPGLGRGPVYGTMDGRHLHPWLNIALLNVLFNIVRTARETRASRQARNLLHGGPLARRQRRATETAAAAHSDGPGE